MRRYRVIEHTADLGLVVCGKTPADLFANAAFAVFDLITDLSAVRPEKERRIELTGMDWEDLLVNYLREILYMYNGEKLLLANFAIKEIDPHHLLGEVWGEPYDAQRHRIGREIKAITYHGAEVCETEEGWRGKAIFDV